MKFSLENLILVNICCKCLIYNIVIIFSISAALKILEDNKDLIGFSHFSLECDTLEKVFLDLCSEAENGSSMLRNSQDSIASAPSIGILFYLL